jgi:hypothetical protein
VVVAVGVIGVSREPSLSLPLSQKLDGVHINL